MWLALDPHKPATAWHWLPPHHQQLRCPGLPLLLLPVHLPLPPLLQPLLRRHLFHLLEQEHLLPLLLLLQLLQLQFRLLHSHLVLLLLLLVLGVVQVPWQKHSPHHRHCLCHLRQLPPCAQCPCAGSAHPCRDPCA